MSSERRAEASLRRKADRYRSEYAELWMRRYEDRTGRPLYVATTGLPAGIAYRLPWPMRPGRAAFFMAGLYGVVAAALFLLTPVVGLWSLGIGVAAAVALHFAVRAIPPRDVAARREHARIADDELIEDLAEVDEAFEADVTDTLAVMREMRSIHGPREKN